MADELAQDPSLAALKLVAWAADDSLLPRAGERGFPHWGRWAERNKRFTSDIVQWFAQGVLPILRFKTLTWAHNLTHVLAVSTVAVLIACIRTARTPLPGN